MPKMIKSVWHDRTWDDNWNDVMRYLYNDQMLKDLMLIPAEDDNIVSFRDKYFIAGKTADEIVTNEKVRIIFYEDDDREVSMNVFRKYLYLSIYVKNDEMYTVGIDRLKRRDIAIEERLTYLLTHQSRVCQMAYRYVGAYDGITRTIGYKAHHLVFSYYVTK